MSHSTKCHVSLVTPVVSKNMKFRLSRNLMKFDWVTRFRETIPVLFGVAIKTKVVKTGPAQSVQPEKPRTGPGTGPVELGKPGSAKNRDKTDHPSIEPVTRPTRCRVTRFLLFCPSFDHAAPFLKKLHGFLTFYFIDFF